MPESPESPESPEFPESPFNLPPHVEADLIAYHWGLFLEFQKQMLAKKLPVRKRRLLKAIAKVIEDHPEEALALFGSGFTGGITAITRLLEEAHEFFHIQQEMQNVPDKKRPRA